MTHSSIAVMIKIASLEFDKLSNQMLSKYDLTSSQFKVLKFLLKRPELNIRQIDIEKFFSMTNPTVTGILQNLEKKQMIERVQNPLDCRSKVIRLTKKVYTIKDELIKMGDDIEAQFTQNLSQEEKEQLKMLLKKILGE